MTGLDLELFLQWLRADLGLWVSLGTVVLLFGLKAWTSWGSNRALRKCLVLSVAAHLGLLLYGSTIPAVTKALRPGEQAEPVAEPVRVRLTGGDGSDPAAGGGEGPGRRPGAAWDLAGRPLALADAPTIPRPEPLRPPAPDEAGPTEPLPPLDATTVAPSLEPPADPEPLNRPDPTAPAIPTTVAPVAPTEIAAARPIRPPASNRSTLPTSETDLNRRLRAARGTNPTSEPAPGPRTSLGAVNPPPGAVALGRDATEPPSEPVGVPDGAADEPHGGVAPDAGPAPAEPVKLAARPAASAALPASDVLDRFRAGRPTPPPRPAQVPARTNPIATPRATPSGIGALADARGAPGGRSLAEVPPDYRSRLDPNRSVVAQKAGASSASEEAVERALDWLRRHQDADGRWDGGTAKYDDGRIPAGEDDFTSHCPPGEVCFGECRYHDADTALTGLSLLAYLGAGYTHTEGKYAGTVGKGLQYLIRAQKPDGDLRGDGATVGMYCHAMAGLALCEAYALTGDARLRGPAERAVAFAASAQAADGMSWRYRPREQIGDTSILGWVIMLLRSAKSVGIGVPAEARAGATRWLKLVSDGKSGGLARYQPGKEVTPTMTAEAWVCRQFLDLAGPGAASEEAAAFLLERSPSSEPYNVYYLYYGTLAMYQHGGAAWDRWNAQVRDPLVARQRTTGHLAGSWDPDDSPYGVYGGRIYGTALATLTLEVYYRYLRLYQAPANAPGRPDDPTLRRAGNRPAR